MSKITNRALLVLVSLIVSIIASSGAITTVEGSGTSSASAGWQAAELLESLTGDGYSPQIAMNDDGDAISVWSQYDGSVNSIYTAKYWSSNNTWGTAKLLESLSGDAEIPQIAMDDDGNAIAVWSQYDGSVNSIYAAKYWSSNNTWGTAKLLETADNEAPYTQIAMDNDGDAIAVWSQFYGSYYNLYAAKYWSSNNTWGTAKLLESLSGDAENAQIAMNDDGDAIVIWCEASSYSIYAAKYWSSNNTWGTAKLLETASGAATTPQIAMNDDGNAMVVWQQYDGSATSIYAAKYWSSNNTWSVRVLLEATDARSSNPQIAMDNDGDAIAVWQQGDSAYSIYASVYSNGAWGTATLLKSLSSNAYSPQIAMDDEGDAMVVWQQGDNPYGVYATIYSNGAWGTATLLKSLSSAVDGCQIAMEDAGDAIAVWQQGDSAYSIYAAVFINPTKLTITSPSDGSTVTTPSVRVNGTTGPGASVVVNGYVVYVDDDGNFSVVLALEEGKNIITVTAINETLGLTTSVSIVITYENDMQDEIDDLKENATEQQELIAALQARLNAAEAAISATNAWLSSVSDTLEECYDAQNASADEMASMLANITSMKASLVSLRASLNDTNGNLVSTDANATALADDLDDTIAQLSSIETNLQARIDATNNRISEVYDKLNATKLWLQLVSDNLVDCYDAQNATAAQVADMLGDIVTMKASMVELRASMNDTNGNLISTDANVTALADDLDNVIAELTSAETTLMAIQSAQADDAGSSSDPTALMLGSIGLVLGIMAIGLVLFFNMRKPKTK